MPAPRALAGAVDLVRGWFDDGARVVAIDGLGASGTSTLAALVAAELAASDVADIDVVTLDDFTRPGAVGWERDRFVRQVYAPVRAGEPVRYQRHHWTSPVPTEWVELAAGRRLLVEGIGASEPPAGVTWDRLLWLAAPAPVRNDRARRRDPDRHACWSGTWAPIEDEWFVRTSPWTKADAVWVNAG
ncbi:hypothetical protein ACSDQ9_12555 [Aestuariimicrobium soli]|uniref:hypothetical protein n=1 Tax=Aestuariimicrobium soli TaxID=2035834 RepID=UPI003EBA5F87